MSSLFFIDFSHYALANENPASLKKSVNRKSVSPPKHVAIPRAQVGWTIEATGDAPDLSDLALPSMPILTFPAATKLNPGLLILQDARTLEAFAPLPPQSYQQVFTYP